MVLVSVNCVALPATVEQRLKLVPSVDLHTSFEVPAGVALVQVIIVLLANELSLISTFVGVPGARPEPPSVPSAAVGLGT